MYQPTDRRHRAIGSTGALLLALTIGWVLVLGLRVQPGARSLEPRLDVFDSAPQPPPPEPAPRPRPARAPHAAGAAAPPAEKARATEIVAPPPPLPTPQTVVAAPVAHDDAAPTQGAAPLPGPGTGAAGTGDGFGGGNGGDGDGGGGGGSPLRQTGGRITGRDYPPDLLHAHRGGTVWVRYTVGVDGRAHDCGIARSSGYGELDETTCRLIVERFRFRAKRDASGRKVPAVVVEDHRWVVDE